jgi:hypothetical protein
MSTEDYECVFSGISAQAGDFDESDGLGDMPVGWTKVSITRRQYNPKYVMIQQTKTTMIESLIQQLGGEAMPDYQKYAISLQVEAQFVGLEAQTPVFLPDIEEEVFISDTAEVLESFNELREGLGLETLEVYAQPEEEETEDTPALSTEEAQKDQIEVAV